MNWIRAVAATTAFFLISGCAIKHEVDYAAGKTTSPEYAKFLGEGKFIPDIETFMQIGSCALPQISNDGRAVYFIGDQTGIKQLYTVSGDGWPYQLTFFPDGVDFYALSHSGSFAIVGASPGGSELSQLYIIDAQTGRLRQLTNLPNVQYGTVVWSPDDRTIYFRSNAENLRDFKLYRMNLADGATTRLLDIPGSNSWADISPDGQRLLYVHEISSYSTDVFVFNAETGIVDHLTPHTGDIIYGSPCFAADGNSVYLTCNDNPKGLNLRAEIKISSHDLKFLDSDSQYNVDTLCLSSDRMIMAWIQNEDGYGRLRLANIKSGRELPAPNLDGVVSAIGLSEISELTLGFNAANRPPDVWRWNWQSGKLTQVTHAPLVGIDAETFAVPKLVTYESFDGLKIPAWIYLPPNYKSGPIPLIVYMHGGPESQARPTFSRGFQYLIQHGYAIFAPNVRGSDGYGRDYLNMDNYRLRLNSVKDMKAGVDWLVKNGYTAPGMIGIRGGSYGGYMTMAGITEYPTLFSAAVDEVGIVNFVSFLEKTSAYRRALREAEYGPLTDPDFLKSISPITKANLIRTPLMVVHGINDPRVPIDEARQVIAAVKSNGGVVDSLIFPDEGHGVAKRPNLMVYYRAMVAFLDKYLKKPQS
jgi:dipeptidyl aminopeptidase/acylaminoacyl peptidase